MANNLTDVEKMIAENGIEPRDGVPDSFVNSIGKTVYCNPLPPDYLQRISNSIEKKYRDRGEPLDKPTYTFMAEGDTEVTAEHDETTLESDEDRLAWAAYVDANQRLNTETGETIMRAACIRGINFEKHRGDFESWVDLEAFIRDLPENENERRFEFARSELIVTTTGIMDEDGPKSDDMKLSETCILLAFKGATREQIDQMRSMFRGSMVQARIGVDPSGTASDTGE